MHHYVEFQLRCAFVFFMNMVSNLSLEEIRTNLYAVYNSHICQYLRDGVQNLIHKISPFWDTDSCYWCNHIGLILAQ